MLKPKIAAFSGLLEFQSFVFHFYSFLETSGRRISETANFQTRFRKDDFFRLSLEKKSDIVCGLFSFRERLLF